jgi:chemotaxis signal transduction protein
MMTGGVLFRVADQLYFLPATIASKVLPMPGVAHVPGAPAELVGVALVEGEMVPVVAIGDLDARGSRRPPAPDRPRADNRPMLVCSYLGERVGLVGLEIVATGRFESPDPETIEHGGVRAALFDVGAVVSRLREHRWAV